MTMGQFLPLAIVASSLIPGILIFFVPERRATTRSVLNLSGAAAKVVLVGVVIWRSLQGLEHELRYDIGADLVFRLNADGPALLFASLSSVLWLVTTIYAIGYLEGSPFRRRFFGFFSLCVTASTGIALAGNVVTFFIFYEFLTLATYPLVVHRGTPEALQAGRTYLWYTIGGGTVLFVGVVWLFVLTGPADFGDTERLAALAPESVATLHLLFWVLILGLGVKAALVPLHGWLPVAMVAPAPVSALLHAVAVVKAGAFGVVRIVYDVFGIGLARELSLLEPLAVIAAITIIYGSLRALTQDNIKRRLAYSTVSQLSYIALGVAIPGTLATAAALVHLVHQGVMKITLFFCAGNLAETLKIHKVSELDGIGRRMPLTMGAFTIGALGMIGMPPVAGFITKWMLGLGGLQTGDGWIILILMASSALNAAYFLPILHAAWLRPAKQEWKTHRPAKWGEAPWMLLVPTLVAGLLSLLLGLFAATGWSILAWATAIADTWYPATTP